MNISVGLCTKILNNTWDKIYFGYNIIAGILQTYRNIVLIFYIKSKVDVHNKKLFWIYGKWSRFWSIKQIKYRSSVLVQLDALK